MNLAMLGSHLECSLKNEMLKKVNNDLKANAAGPQVLVAIVGICQLLSASAVHKLECNLQALHLANEPGQNVDAFSQKVTEIAKCLDGVGNELKPKDLNLLVIGCFRESLTLAFELQVLKQCDKVDSSPLTTEKWDVVVDSLKTKHCSLGANDMWEAKKVHKENPAQALQASVDRLSKKLDGKLQIPPCKMATMVATTRS